jgi:hypothetical protein
LVLDFVADNHMFQGFWKTQVRCHFSSARQIADQLFSTLHSMLFR